MSESNDRQSNRLVVVLGLAMALGPLTALSLGTKYADDETWERAQAGAKNIKPVDVLAQYGKPNGVPSYAADKTLADVVGSSALFDSFEELLAAAGAQDILKGASEYTIFVPSDEAFARLDQGQLQALLQDKDALNRVIARHIVPGRYTATDLMQMRQARTLDGEMIPVGPTASAGGHIGVGAAGVEKSDIFAANGVVHVIDRPIL